MSIAAILIFNCRYHCPGLLMVRASEGPSRHLRGTSSSPRLSAPSWMQRAVVLEGGCRKGELTLLGQSQALDMGRWLRSNYVETAGFLPPTYQDGVVKARTTNISRTIATLRGVLTGLYPDLPKQQHAEHQQQLQQRQQEGYAPQPGSQLPLQQQLQLQPQPQDRRQPSLHSPGVPHVTTSADLDEILYADTRACPHLGSFQAVSRELARGKSRGGRAEGGREGCRMSRRLANATESEVRRNRSCEDGRVTREGLEATQMLSIPSLFDLSFDSSIFNAAVALLHSPSPSASGEATVLPLARSQCRAAVACDFTLPSLSVPRDAGVRFPVYCAEALLRRIV
ncbi:hypothetical protein Vafri_17410 [Volvox africanus]|uniref:Uncharacterized protein n=1 Tax=Volvox africanus TaxID=51714 RepID=A0A8J4BKZ6_9CHLO|nr:hypothetical protein Vafri_17410 [Volvox africanus]